MGRFVEGEDRRQSLLLPESLDDYVTEDNPDIGDSRISVRISATVHLSAYFFIS